jgi:hypothetical protein
MSLACTGSSTDKVAISNLPPLASGSAFTWFQWFMRNGTFANSQGMSLSGSILTDLFAFSTASNAIFCSIGRATTASVAQTLTIPALNAWEFWAGTYDETDGARYFRGGLDSPVAEVSYSTRTTGVGATAANNAPVLYVNNRGAASALAFPLNLGVFAWFDRRMSLTELAHQQYAPRPDLSCKFFSNMGQTRLAAEDLNGANDGAPTGMTIGSPLPLQLPSRFDRFDRPAPPQLVMI